MASRNPVGRGAQRSMRRSHISVVEVFSPVEEGPVVEKEPVDEEPVDEEPEGEESAGRTGDSDTTPLLSFESDTAAMPHWADAPTGELPVIESPGAADPTPAGGSRLFPQLPDDPNLVDTSESNRFDAVRSDTLPTLDNEGIPPEDAPFAPPSETDPLATGPMELADFGEQAPPPGGSSVVPEPAEPVADTTVIRGLGERDPGSQFDADPESDARDEEMRAATALAGGQIPDFEPLVSDISGSATLQADAEDPQEGQMGDDPDNDDVPLIADAAQDDPWARLDALPDVDDAPTASTPAAAEDGFPTPPDVTALFDDDAPAVVAPLGASTEAVETVQSAEDDGDRLDSWADLDAPAPHWREGSQDYEERAVVNEDERTVLHFDGPDSGAPEGGDEASGGRNVPMAILVGALLAAAFAGLLRIGPGAAMVMVVLALVLGAAEFYQAVRNVGYRPAALLGMATVAGLALAVYWKGFEAYPLVMGLAVVAGLLWFLFGVESEHATANLAITMMGIGWIGVLGSFAALILKMPDGEAVLIGAVVGTVAYDVGGYVIGRTTGQSRLAPHISPNKTYEGLIGGMILAIVVTTLSMNSIPGVFPWTVKMTDALWLGIAVAVMAPLGDLCQSLIKRDLGVKDMGTLLPGHGGVFDRFDALLFVLPAAYYVADTVVY